MVCVLLGRRFHFPFDMAITRGHTVGGAEVRARDNSHRDTCTAHCPAAAEAKLLRACGYDGGREEGEGEHAMLVL